MKKRKYIIKAAALVLAETDAVEETLESGTQDAVQDESNKTQGQDRSDIMAQDIIDYPFPSGVEGRRLVLCTDKAAGEENAFRIRLYDEDRNLVQEFPCEIGAEELIFRFDRELYNQMGFSGGLPGGCGNESGGWSFVCMELRGTEV